MASVVQGIDYAQIAPPLIVGGGAVVALVGELFVPVRRKILVSWLSLAVLVGALASAVALWPGRRVGTFCMQVVNLTQNLEPGTGTARTGTIPVCSYQADKFTLLFQFVALGGAILVVLMTAATIRRDRVPTGEFHFLLLCSVTGALVLAASRDLITLTVGLETVSVPAFALVGLKRWSGRSSEAALKFFLVSVASTGVMLFGMSLVYGTTGAVHFDAVFHGLAHPYPGTSAQHHLALLGIALTLVGFAFKVSAVPFHFWTPDTYAGAPIPVAAYLSVVSKAAGFAGLMLLLGRAFAPELGHTGPLIAVLAALTMSVGNLVALRQTDAVRLLAWSTVGQAGYILVPLAARDPLDWHRYVGKSVAYIIMYAAMNLGAFAVVNSVPRTSLEAYRGLAKTRPLASAALAFFLLCLAGLPPGLMGLFAKIAVFGAATGSHLTWLAVVMAVNVVVALYYYLAWAAKLFAAPGEATAPAAAGGAGRSPVVLRLAIGLSLAAAVVLSVWPQPALGALPLF
jgi:NADH-quinone oxidoreductase subunit N